MGAVSWPIRVGPIRNLRRSTLPIINVMGLLGFSPRDTGKYMREHPSWAAGRIAVGAAMIAMVLLAGNTACWVIGFVVDTDGFWWWATSWILTIILGACVTLVISVAYDMQQETKEKSVVTKKQVEREAVDTKAKHFIERCQCCEDADTVVKQLDASSNPERLAREHVIKLFDVNFGPEGAENVRRHDKFDWRLCWESNGQEFGWESSEAFGSSKLS